MEMNGWRRHSGEEGKDMDEREKAGLIPTVPAGSGGIPEIRQGRSREE